MSKKAVGVVKKINYDIRLSGRLIVTVSITNSKDFKAAIGEDNLFLSNNAQLEIFDFEILEDHKLELTCITVKSLTDKSDVASLKEIAECLYNTQVYKEEDEG